MKLSIILPAYNVGSYIERCIRSLADQDVSKNEYEIIVTNDGSPDNVSDIVKNLQKEFSNLVLIDQENQGVSMARNNAIHIAKGSYIMPIDPDDYVEPNSFKDIFKILEENDLDCLFLKVQKIDNEFNIVWETDYSEYTGKINTSLIPFHETKGENVLLGDPDRSTAVLFKKSIIEKFNTYYPKDVPFLEDGIFIAKYLSVARNYMLLDGDFYWRTIREGSATNSDLFSSRIARIGYLNGLDDLYSFLVKNKENILDLEREAFLKQMYIHFSILPIIAAINAKDLKAYLKQIKLLKGKVKKVSLEGLRNPYDLYGKAFFFSPIAFSIVYILKTISQIIKRKFS